MTEPKDIIKRIRGKFVRKTPPVEDPAERARVEFLVKMEQGQDWEASKALVRDRNFAKAQAARDAQLEEKRLAREAEEARLTAIYETRLKSLKKARRALKKMRNTGDE